jgi:iron complex outermembrane receptor protein
VATFFTSVIDPLTNQITQISGVFAGNPTLRAEKSESSTLGFIFEPTQNVTVGVNYYRITWKDIVASPTFQSIVNSGDPARVIRDPNNNNAIVTVLSNYQNLNETKTNGLDLEARYRMPSDFGRWTARTNFSYVNSFKEEGVEIAGTNGGNNTIPRVRGNVAVDWDYRAFANTLQMNYIRGYLQQLLPGSFFAQQDPRFQNGTYPTRVPSYISYDWYGKYTLTKNLSISAAVLNLRDKKPNYDPGFSGTFLYDFSIYDIRGRQIRLGLTYKL